MRYQIDYASLDEDRWDEYDPAHDFLTDVWRTSFGKILLLSGVRFELSYIHDNGDRSPIARQHGYEINDGCRVSELLIGGIDNRCDYLSFGVCDRIFSMLNISYGLMLGLTPAQIISPAAWYGIHAERNALNNYMRSISEEEIRRRSDVVRIADQSIIKRLKKRGLYCFDESKRALLEKNIRKLIDGGERHHFNGEFWNIRDTLSDKILALLKFNHLSEANIFLRNVNIKRA